MKSSDYNGLRDIKRQQKNLNDSIFCLIMANEVTDCSNKEQCHFRWVDKGFNTHEDFIGS